MPIPPPTKPRPDQDLARGVGAVGAAEDVPYEEFLTSCGFAPDRSTGALPSSTAETSAKAPQKLPNGVLTLPAEWISSSFALSPNVFLLA